MSKKLKIIEKILNFFYEKPILSIIYELCQYLGSIRSLWKAPEAKTLGGGVGGAMSAPLQSRVNKDPGVQSNTTLL